MRGTAEVRGAGFHFELAGEGRPLVLLHAGICDGRMWDGQFDALARGRRVLRYDRRGFGRTTQGAGAFSHVEDLKALLSYLGLGRVTLVGCSQGAKIALDLALKHPESVDSLVLVAPAVSGYAHASPPPPRYEEIERAGAAGDIERVNELELQTWVDGPRRSPGEVDRAVREVVREMNRAALTSSAGEELPPGVSAAARLGEVRVPTLVVVGDLDTPRTVEAAHALAGGVPFARLEIIKGTAHLPNMERPEEFNRLVLEFLDGPGGGSEDR
ncbi:MAG: alpha/beta fold hydrolase [Acidobacteria bacterium]|nr:alpha/beta fold hydrolase [Acidobacteriota bacterium]